MSELRVTLSTIASLAGVNASTVSRALNSRTAGMVECRLRARILSLSDELGYRPGLLGKSFATGKTFKIGFITGSTQNDLSSPFLAQLLSSLALYLQSYNYSLTILPYCGGPQGDSLRQLLMSDVADGYILGVSMLDAQTRDILRNSNRLIVALDLHQWREQDDFSCLILDDLLAYRQIWRALPVSWYRQVLFVGEPGINTDYKLAKMRQAALFCGVGKSEIAVRLLPQLNTHFTLNRQHAFVYAEEHWRALAKYKLLWCASDLTALGLADALSRRGLRIGTDICLVGQDNIESLYGALYQPLLTTVDPQMAEAGLQTAELLLRQLTQTKPKMIPTKIKLPSKLIFRTSLPRK